jgi:hypothetical protein
VPTAYHRLMPERVWTACQDDYGCGPVGPSFTSRELAEAYAGRLDRRHGNHHTVEGRPLLDRLPVDVVSHCRMGCVHWDGTLHEDGPRTSEFEDHAPPREIRERELSYGIDVAVWHRDADQAAHIFLGRVELIRAVLRGAAWRELSRCPYCPGA